MLFLTGKIPLRVHPLFLLFALIIGWLNTGRFTLALVWVGIIFVSVLVHELGHALTGLGWGQRVQIDLVALGGVTRRNGPKLAWWKEFVIVLCGPLAGFLLGIVAFICAISMANSASHPLILYIFEVTFVVNMFWTVVNLLPIIPLDGGQLLRILMERFFGLKGLKIAQFSSFVLAAVLGMVFFLLHNPILGAIFFLIAFEGFQMWKSVAETTEKDQDNLLLVKMAAAEKTLREGRVEEAIHLFQDVRTEAKEGVIYRAATELLANAFADRGEYGKAYELLNPIRSYLSQDGMKMLQTVAFQNGEIAEAIKIGNELFQNEPNYSIAVLNAVCHALRDEERPAVGWLQSAIREGLPNIAEVLRKPEFDHIRESALFRNFEKNVLSQ